MNKTTIKLIAIIAAFAFVLGGCSIFPKIQSTTKIPLKTKPLIKTELPKSIADQLAAQTKIKKFADYDELKEFLEQGAAESSYGLGYDSGIMRGEMMLDSTAAPMTMKSMEAGQAISEATGLGAGSDDFSKTNVQVEGVDEADIIKTDGKYIYAVSQKNLFIVNAYPADQAKVIAKIAFESRPQDIYIQDNSLVVFGHDDLIYKTELYKNFRRRSNYTFFKVFDITDRKNPKQVRDLDFEGNYSNSRMIGDYVYFVTQNRNYYYDDEMPVPRILEDGKVMTQDCSLSSVRCYVPDVYYFDIPYQSYNFTSVNAINVKDHKRVVSGDVYLLSGNQNMYVSQNNIYITYTKHISEYQLMMEVMKEVVHPKLNIKNQERIAKIEAVENFILSQQEKMNKINYIVERYISSLTDDEQDKLEDEVEKNLKQKYADISKELEKTVIHKIAVSDGALEYKTFGEVTGQVLNQFSMDERDGYFRIATTKNRTWSRFENERQESYNNLYVLDSGLKIVGALENLAEGEKIYSVRFMQNRAYMVTFKQIDPLFVIDLTDPKNPKVLGELKIPGYSDYLHPYDDTTLIGLGKDTGESEWGGVKIKGLKLSLFDVSDVSDPKEIDVYIMGDSGSDSIALHDHKAFLFSRDKNLLSIPVSIRESLDGRSWGKMTFSGAAVFKVDKTGFELKGKIDHSDGGRISDRDYWRGYSYYDNTVKRSLYIDDVLYTFSNKYLKMNQLKDLDLVKKLELKKDKSGTGDDFEVVN
ncbi:beta-propeller domain-containing protein [Candidatus Parcubacteria bacterium]|nr:beta-propeller domain-containing protein [Candidatus Parcubacteria bacterium]